MGIKCINLEQGMPKVEEAMKIADRELYNASEGKQIAIKFIHGYGSTGVGGRIKQVITNYLEMQKKRGGIHDYITGENWTIFNTRVLPILDNYPILRKEQDLNRNNCGITIVIL